MTIDAGEVPLLFRCGGDDLVGVLHRPAVPSRIGVIVITGGPQYRIGSHRQFVLLARHLAAHGIAVLRFDVRGMGDSGGEFPGFEQIDPDIAAAVDCLIGRVPEVERVALWGLCDAASAILLYAPGDARVKGIALLNPWVRTEAGLARTYVKHYYLRRLRDPEFWRKVARGEFSLVAAARALLSNLGQALRPRAQVVASGKACAARSMPLPDRMSQGLSRFHGPVLTVLSGRDLTAKEFEEAVSSSSVWRRLLAERRVTRRRLDESDHTFSRREWCDQVASWTLDWLRAELSAQEK